MWKTVNSLRVRRLNQARAQSRGRDYILCWLQQALRADDNPIIDAAIDAGNRYNKPVLVYHGLSQRYPHASDRLHRFILQAQRSLAQGVTARGLRFCGYVERAEKREPGLVYRLAERATMVVTDDVPAFVARHQAARLAARLKIPVLAVDACCLVPMASFTELLDTTPAFRRAHTPLRTAALAQLSGGDQPPSTAPFDGELGFEPDDLTALDAAALDAMIAGCEIDHTLPPARGFDGSRTAALARLSYAISAVLPNYNFNRNNPADPDSSSRLSPYLHFGILSPREVVQAVRDAEVHAAPRYKFLDEMLTWREFFYHLARFSDDPTAYENVPQQARATLADHAHDPRPVIYPLTALLHGETEDETWNAAQKQYLIDGWMHNNLRMYWGKKLLEWCEAPANAWHTACYLNDRLSLDGRDPATYGNLQWCFGRSKLAQRESRIYGRVPRKTDVAIRRRRGVTAWLSEQAARKAPPVDLD